MFNETENSAIKTIDGTIGEPSFTQHGAGEQFDERTAKERAARFRASADMLFRTDVSRLDDISADALYRSATEGMFGIADKDGTFAFGKRAAKDAKGNIELMRRFLKGEWSLIEDPEYKRWREMDEETKFRYALEHEGDPEKIKSWAKGERGAGLWEQLAGGLAISAPGLPAGAMAATQPEHIRKQNEAVAKETSRRSNYESLTDEEKAQYRTDVIGDYERKLSRQETLEAFLRYSQGLNDKAAYLLAKSLNSGELDAINIETLADKEQRDRVYSAFSAIRGSQKKGRILGIETDFTDGTSMNRVQLGLYGLQQGILGLVTDTGEFATDLALKAYSKVALDEQERKEFWKGRDATVRAERAMEQGLPEPDTLFGWMFQGVMENGHWFIPYGALEGKGAKLFKGANATIKAAKEDMAILKAGMKVRQAAALERYTKALQAIPKEIATARAVRDVGAGMWLTGEAMAFSAFAEEYMRSADAAGISREESVFTAAAVGLINAQIERLYIPGLESSLTPTQLKSMMWRSALQAIRSDGAAGFKKYLFNRIPKDLAQFARVATTEGIIEEPLQQMAIEHGKAFDLECQKLREEGKAEAADKAMAFFRSVQTTLAQDWGTFVDTAADSLPTALGFGLTSVGNMKARQHYHDIITRHANRRAGSTGTMGAARSVEELYKAADYDSGLADWLQQAMDIRTTMERQWGEGEKNPNRFAEAMTAARRAYRNAATGDMVQEIADAAGVDVKTAEALVGYFQVEDEATAFSPKAKAVRDVAMSLADIDEKTIASLIPGYIEGSWAADAEKGVYSGRVRLGDGTERTIAYRIGDLSELSRKYAEQQSKIGSQLGASFDARHRSLGDGVTWESLTEAQRYTAALTQANGFSGGESGVFELKDANGETVIVNADDVINLANGRLGDIGYGPAATQATVRHETFHALWRFARGTMETADVEALAKSLGVDTASESWEKDLDEAMAVEMEQYASGHWVSNAAQSRFDKMLQGWAGKLIGWIGRCSAGDEVTNPKTGKPFALKGLYDSVLKGEIGSGAFGVELRKSGAKPAPEVARESATPQKGGAPVEVTDEEREAHEAEERQAAAAGTQNGDVGTENANLETQNAVPETPAATAENPADAATPNQRYYKIGLPNSEVKLVGRLEVRDAATGLITSTDAEYHDRGNQNRDDKSEESRALVEKIGANPDPLQIGTVQPIANNGIVWALPNGDVIIGNHRVNGVRLSYEKGTASALDKFVREDAAKRGIEIADDVKRPMPVFILEKIDSPDGKADAHEVVRLANESQNRGFNVREQAQNDAKVLADNNLLPRMAFRPDGRIDETKSGDAIGKFRQETGAQGMVGEDGMLTEEGQTRIQNAALAALLAGSGSNALLQKIMSNAGLLDMSSELRALMKMTPELMALAETKPAFDLRGPLAEALQLFAEWREKDETGRVEKGKTRHDWRETKGGKRVRGLSWEAFMSQGDMFRTPSEEAKMLGDMFAKAESLRSFDREDVESAAGKKRVIDLISDYITDYIENAKAANTETDDIFGAPPPSRIEVMSAQRAKGEGGPRFSVAIEEGISQNEAKDRLRSQRGNHTNRRTGITARLSADGAGKLVSNAAVAKTVANGFTAKQHNELAANIGVIFADASLAEDRPDRNGDTNIRSIKRFVTPVSINGQEAVAWTTVKESTEHGHRIYSVEGIKIAALSPAVRRVLANRNSADNAPTQESISNIGGERQGRFSIGGVYTGSAADYDKPSVKYIGTGEGSQVYGWGLYGSTERGVGESYATYRDSDHAIILVDGKEWKPAKDAPIGERTAYEQLDDFSNSPEEIAEYCESQEGKHYKEAAKFIRSHDIEIKEPHTYLYEQTFFTNRAPGDESHLLKWYEPVSEEQLKWIEEQAKKEGLTEKFENEKKWRGFDGSFRQFITDNGRTADAIYEQLSNSGLAHSDNKYRDTSEFLYRAGIDGIKYPVDSFGKTVKDGDKAGWNYVSFSDKNIRVDHKWRDGEQRFSISAPVERKKDLIAFHNVSADGLRGMDELGGLAVPSFAVTKDTIGGDEFGEISLLVRPETVNPKRRGNKIYSNDAWTPTFPETVVKIDDKALERIQERIIPLFRDTANKPWGDVVSWSSDINSDNIDTSMNRAGGNAIAALRERDTFKAAYLIEKGKLPALPMRKTEYFGSTSSTPNSVVRWINNDAVAALSEKLSDRLLPDGKQLSASECKALESDAELQRQIAEIIDSTPRRKEVRANHKSAKPLAEMVAENPLSSIDFDDISVAIDSYRDDGGRQVPDRTAAIRALDAAIDEDKAGYEKWLGELSDGLTDGKRYVRNKKDPFAPSGRRRSFSELHDPLTLAAAVKAMLKQRTQGNGIFGRNPFGVAAKQYASLDEVRADKGRLQKRTREKVEAGKKKLVDRLGEIIAEYNKTQTSPDDNPFMQYDNAADMMMDAYAAARNDKERLAKELNGWGYTASPDLIDRFVAVMDDMASMPEDYFEAKAYRAVGFDEIAAAVVPDNATEATKDILSRNGVAAYSYKAGDKADRLRALNEAADSHRGLRFSIAAPEQSELLERPAIAYPQLRTMGDDELLAAAIASRIALGKSDKLADRSVTINTVQRLMKRLHPEMGTTDIGRESLRVLSDAKKLGKRIREDLDRGVSESKILKYLPETARETFGGEMRQEARRGAALGEFGEKAAQELEERKARVIENAVRVQTGLDADMLENAFGINLSDTLMRIAENPMPENPAKPVPPAGGEAVGATGVVSSGGGEDVAAKASAAVMAIVETAKKYADENAELRKERKARQAQSASAAGEGAEGADNLQDAAGDGDIVAVATRKAGLDLENPRHLAEFVAELTRRYWIKEHSLALNADVWRDPVAVQFLRKTAESVYSKLVRDLTYSRGRETATQHIARLASIPTVNGLLSEMEFIGAIINARKIHDTQKALCEQLDLFLREKFGAQGRFRPDKEEGKRNVSTEAELRARYMRHAMWLTPQAASEEAMELAQTLNSLAVEFDEAGRDADQSRVHTETVRKLGVLREFGALRYKPVGEIEAAIRWWEDFARGDSDEILREQADRDIRTKKAAHLLAVAFADPDRKTAREGGVADLMNKYITGHMSFISLLQDCARHASDADRAAAQPIVDWLALEIQKSGDRSETEKRRHNDAFHTAVEGIYGKSFNAVMKDMMAPDERFTKYMGVVGGKRVTPMKGRALQLLVSLLQEGRKVQVEDEDNPGQTKTVWEGGYHDNIVKHHREGQAAEIMRLLDPADMNMLKWLGQWYENNRADLSGVCHSLFGIGVYAELPNYFPVKMLLEKQGLEKGEGVGWTIFPKALTPRVKNERDFDTSADIFQMWASRMEEAAQWKSHAALGLELRGIFGRAELREAVRANHGASVDELMQGFITDILAGHGAYDRSTAGVQYFSDQIRGWTALCALGGNVGVMLKQPTSIPAFGFEIGLVNTAKYMVNAFTPEGMAAMAKIWDSEQRRTRWQVGSSEAVRNALNQQGAGALKRMFQASMITNKLGDVVPALIVGQGIYRDCLARGMSEEDAMAETWSIVERTQQSGRMENQTQVQRRNKLGRIMFQFLSTQQQYLQYEARAIREVIARPDSVKRWGNLGRAIILNHFILSSAYFWMGELYKAMLGQEPPEDELKDWVITCLLGPYGSLFVLGFCCKYTLERALKGYSIRGGSSMLPMESWLKTQINDGARLLEAIFDAEGDTLDAILDAAGRWMSDSNSIVRDLRKIYRFRIKGEK